MLSRKLAITAAALAALAIGAPMAGAQPPYDPDTHQTDVQLPQSSGSGAQQTQPPAPCDYYTWNSPPKVVIHTGEFVGGATRRANMIAAIEAVDEEFNLV